MLSPERSTPRRALACALWLIAIACSVPRAGAQSVAPQPHPNHFIILVDASGSVNRATLQSAITGRLLPQLFERGFGRSFPAYDPQQDRVTLLHFGIVERAPTPAYLRLKDYRFLANFIHPIFEYRRATRQEIAEGAVQIAGYEMTILSWAKPLALAWGKGRVANVEGNRTFLIMLSDGKPNGSSTRAEEDEVRRRADKPDLAKTEQAIADVNENYRFVAAEGGDEAGAGADAINQIFIEAYEIVPRAQEALEERARSLAPFEQLSFSWTSESGDRPIGELSAEMKPDFLEWVRSAGTTAGRVSAGTGDPAPAAKDWDLGPVWSLPLTAEGALGCESRSYPVTLVVPVKLNDKLLGARTLEYTYQREVAAPPASSCTYWYWGWRAAAVFALLLLLGAAAYFIYFRFYSTHIYIELSGHAVPIRIARGETVESGTPISPREGLEAFTLHLPGGLLQRIFYRKARVGAEMNGGVRVRLSEGGQTSLGLPSPQRKVEAYWDAVPDHPTTLTLTFEQGRQTSHVILSYPKGISPRGGATRQ
jgi:hypothetical protein